MATPVVIPRTTYDKLELSVVAWFADEGYTVQQGDPLLEVETDKANLTIESPATGILRSLRGKAGETLPVGSTVAFVVDRGEEPPPLPPLPVLEAVDERESAGVPAKPVEPLPGSDAAEHVLATPIARRLAAEHGLSLASLSGSGPGGRIVEADVRSALAASSDSRPASEAGVASTLKDLPRWLKAAGDRLVQSMAPVPQFVVEVQADMTSVQQYRAGQADTGRKAPSVTCWIVLAAAQALREHPNVNARFEQGKLRVFDEVNVAVAIATDQGLIVPVLHQADLLDVQQIQHRLDQLRERAGSGSFQSGDLQGGTFTVSNLGMLGIDAFQAVVDAPQAAILATGRIERQLVVIADAPAIRPLMTMRLSADHRILDGAAASRFLVRIKQLLESWQPPAERSQ